MTATIRLADADGGTELVAVHDGVPDAVRPEDNELGWQESLARLAALVESPRADFLAERVRKVWVDAGLAPR